MLRLFLPYTSGNHSTISSVQPQKQIPVLKYKHKRLYSVSCGFVDGIAIVYDQSMNRGGEICCPEQGCVDRLMQVEYIDEAST
jgi:hypothetical protein